ncbi:MAG: MerC domain-containing protein [Bacteroidota bacterium]
MSKYVRVKQMIPVERLGVFLSFLCAIHCLTMPFVVFFAPYILGSLAFSSTIEWILVLSSFGLAAYILILDYQKHKRLKPLYFLGIALGLKVLEVSLGNQSFNWIFGVLLGATVAYAYWVNYKHKSACTCKMKAS